MPTEKQKEQAWEKAKPIHGKNSNLYRRDSFGNLIYKPAYGKGGDMGWELDHKKPISKGGTDSSRNLQAVQTKTNRKKSDKYPFSKGKKK